MYCHMLCLNSCVLSCSMHLGRNHVESQPKKISALRRGHLSQDSWFHGLTHTSHTQSTCLLVSLGELKTNQSIKHVIGFFLFHIIILFSTPSHWQCGGDCKNSPRCVGSSLEPLCNPNINRGTHVFTSTFKSKTQIKWWNLFKINDRFKEELHLYLKPEIISV